MPRKSTQKPSEQSDSQSVQAVAQVAPAESKTAKKAGRPPRQKDATPAPAPTPVVESAPVAPETTSELPDSKRRVPTQETVQADFDAVSNMIMQEVENLRKASGKSKGVRFLLSVNKAVRKLKLHVQRVSKHRPRTRRNNTNSGFLKPVLLSKELAEFTGWDPKEPRSRVQVTKYICNYIREHNLQNPKNRKQIRVEEDPRLNALLKYDSSKDKVPLDYCHIQTCLKRQGHFLPAVSATPAPAPASRDATPAPKVRAKKATA